MSNIIAHTYRVVDAAHGTAVILAGKPAINLDYDTACAMAMIIPGTIATKSCRASNRVED